MRLAFILESPLGYGGGVSMVVRTLMEGLPKAYQFVLVSRDAEGHLSQDPLFQRIDKHISWQGEKGPRIPSSIKPGIRFLGAWQQPSLIWCIFIREEFILGGTAGPGPAGLLT